MQNSQEVTASCQINPVSGIGKLESVESNRKNDSITVTNNNSSQQTLTDKNLTDIHLTDNHAAKIAQEDLNKAQWFVDEESVKTSRNPTGRQNSIQQSAKDVSNKLSVKLSEKKRVLENLTNNVGKPARRILFEDSTNFPLFSTPVSSSKLTSRTDTSRFRNVSPICRQSVVEQSVDVSAVEQSVDVSKMSENFGISILDSMSLVSGNLSRLITQLVQSS